MEQYIMKGGNPLVGEVTISGAKNAALGILAAAIMTDDDVVIDNLPDVSDINALLDAISHLGAKVDLVHVKQKIICQITYRFRAAFLIRIKYDPAENIVFCIILHDYFIPDVNGYIREQCIFFVLGNSEIDFS